MKIKATLALLLLAPLFLGAQNHTPKTPDDVVSLIKKNVTCDWLSETVDVYKVGNPQTPLKGIITCMFADMNTLKKAVDLGYNFIITHEPIFYSHLDGTETLQDDPVFKEKMDYIQKNKLVIFRFHDHIHMTQPDGISVGMINKLGLRPHSVDGSLTFFKLPEQTVKDYAQSLKSIFGMQSIRVIGNPELKFTNLAFLAGAPGGQRQIQMMRNPEVEVILAGEATEWETYLYANDAKELGKNKAVIFLGHIKSEEAGMEYCAEWLKTFVSGIPIHFIENEANFVTF
ncbi:Nif3-like dinuclear metal center hexameric protein [Maribellus maritimus]|uniref:Nif3-like dinuclear metal center hexameric protein n=1 Tax=Maribellus maritimus TaxID=2870838 RepID=UPI001EEBD399|nr:Nif3-like dinuclear metal center hexameric protein [Maribellus maritimus]MCG6186212.1 Nif3-like dinuclear metal center hexameric protein [Maribellus maritimus]